MYNARFDIIGARWSSLVDFLAEEIPRRFSLYDGEGRETEKSQRLPGNTDDWERLAQEAKNAEQGDGLIKRVFKSFRRN